MPVDIDELLAQMTLEEKLAQLGGVWVTSLVNDDGVRPREDPRGDPARHRTRHPDRRVHRSAARSRARP